MKFRLGLFLMGLLTLLLLKLTSTAFGLINLPSDMAVLIGCVILGGSVIVGPWLYHLIFAKLMKKSITTTTENKNEA